jgi:hypothetical protein
MRTMFTALLVVTAACSEDSSPPDRVLSLTWNQGDGCVVREACFAGTSCAPAAPYETECSQEMAKLTYAKLADGTCRVLPADCKSASCLGDMTECPPHAMDLPTLRWTLERTEDGTDCNVAPQPRTAISKPKETFQVACHKFGEAQVIVRANELCLGEAAGGAQFQVSCPRR